MNDPRSSVEAMRDAVVSRAAATRWTGSWASLVHELRRVAGVDLCLGRLVEGHADAMRILDQAATDPRAGVYGVWASRSLGTGVRATQRAGGWRLDGEVRFASGVDLVDRVLVPGWVDERTHLLFDVATRDFTPDRSSWHTSAMDASRSFTVRADDVAVDEGPVGGENFYLDRPGFDVGGIGPAAVWAGGVRSLLDQVAAGLSAFEPTPHQLRRVGAMRQASWTADAALAGVTTRLDGAPPAEPPDDAAGDVTAARTAAVLAADLVAHEAALVVGPGGLSSATRLVRTSADLGLYVRQHHLDDTLERLGRSSLRDAPAR